VRDFNWDFNAEVQHELRPGFAVNAGYNHNTGGYTRQGGSRQRVTDNLAVVPSDYDEYCVTAPLDSRLPDGGGYRVCGLYNLRPDKFGQSSNLITLREPFGEFESTNDFLTFTFDARLARGIRLGGGVDTGRSVAGNCFVVDSPENLLNCRVVTPFGAQTQFKVNGVFPLKYDIVTSFAFQNLSGPNFTASWTAPASAVEGLGRPLSGSATTVTVPLVEPQTMWQPRISTLDVRVGKIFRVFNRARIQVNLDAYNVLNSSAIRSVTSTYGPNWQRPTQILDPRILQLSGQLSF
jgi:hypothetical protein